jgi:Xaa-Pro aminopeptidase
MERPYRRRIQLVRRLLVKSGAEALVVTHPPNIFYLSGFSGSAGALLIEPHGVTLFIDGRYTTQAREETADARLRITRGSLLTAVGERLRKSERARVAMEPAHMSVAQHRELKRVADAKIRWVALWGPVEELRAVKGADEIAQMRQAARLGCQVFEKVLPLVKPGVREVELAAEIEYRMRQGGASGAAFPTIVASGARAALPHAQPTKKRLRKNELVVLDLGAILAHYCCDLTRTVYLGRAPSGIRRWYQAVQEAQAAARDALCAGVAAGEVDAAARRVLKRFRLDRHFLHSTGHGLGLEVHEEPRLAKGQKKIIQAGNVVTLEPGVYIEGVGGIRSEDDVAVFSDRTETLTSAPRDLLEL